MRAGKILSPCPELAALEPLKAVQYLKPAGWQEIILLDLERVGGGEGVETLLTAEVRATLPGLRLLVGGGLADPEELVALQSLGVSGVLVASALHRGIITVEHISALETPPG
jgi:phosphoribosylformimino-5-aminoimidazole carboxamide ribotide isomerase